MDLEPGVVVAERFRLVRPLGQGGMGAVWLAQHTQLDTPCALKFIHEEASRSPELRSRFEREAKAAAQLRSTHVVQILDHGVWQDQPYIAMEFLEGEDLAKRLRRRRPLEPREVVGIASQVGRALAKAHAAGLIHRDLKPGNIFLAREDDREIAKVLDFGVAKATAVSTPMNGDSENTKTGAILGTPFYMSPEQARGNKDVDHRADLWALSVVIYQCLTGKLPFRSDALGDLLVKIIVEPLPVPSQVLPTVPPGLDAWWKHAADRDITQRFQSAKDLTEALALALDVTIPGTAEVGTSIGFPIPRDADRDSRVPALGAPPSHPSAPGATPRPSSQASSAEATAPATAEPEMLDSALLLTSGTTATPSPAPPDSLSAPSEPPLPVTSRKPLFAAAVAAAVLLVGVGVVALRGSTAAPGSQPGPLGSAPTTAATATASSSAATAAPSAPTPLASAAPPAASVAPAESARPPGRASGTPAPGGEPLKPRSAAAPGTKAPVKPRTDFGI